MHCFRSAAAAGVRLFSRRLVTKRICCNAILTGWMDTSGESATQRKFHGADDDCLAKAEVAQPMEQLVKPRPGRNTRCLYPESGGGIMTGMLLEPIPSSSLEALSGVLQRSVFHAADYLTTTRMARDDALPVSGIRRIRADCW